MISSLDKENFEEIDKGFSIQEAILEAKRCLNCKKPLCVEGCPISHDIPGFIHQISKGNMGESMNIIQQKSNLPSICGRVCPHENQCEGHCILNKKSNPIKIGKLERFIADFDGDYSLIKEKLRQKNRGKVAVIGSGPAGLTVAGDLAKEGFNVVIYEAQEEGGGILLYGIPEYRLPRTVVNREVSKIEALGVSFIYNTVVGRDLTVDDMFLRGFDAIFIGTGTAIPKTLDIKGADLNGVMQSSYLLRMSYLYANGLDNTQKTIIKPTDNVVVIGAGNVGMDTARTAARLGANSVRVVYYKDKDKMPALKSEYEDAVEDGVLFNWNTNTKKFMGVKNKLTEILVETPEGEEIIPCDKVFLAIGAKPANKIVSTTSGICIDENGYVKTSKLPYGMTTRKGVFAGGDVVHTPKTVVLAMREAKEVAKGIAQYVDAVKLLGV